MTFAAQETRPYHGHHQWRAERFAYSKEAEGYAGNSLATGRDIEAWQGSAEEPGEACLKQ
jgi:hypothetical protein